MRVFVYEYLSAQPAVEVASLRREGRAMLAAVSEDLRGCPGVEVVTLAAVPADAEEARFRALARAADFALVIAPEFDRLLRRRCRWAEEEGARLLGPSAAAVGLAADKLHLADLWRRAGVPTPPTAPLRQAPWPFPLVCKPRDGAGSQATYLVRDAEGLGACAAHAQAEGWHGEMVVQPYVHGLPASVAFLGDEPLRACAQALSDDGRFRYQGGWLPLPPALEERAGRLARRAAAAVPGMAGYFGVDLVLGDADDGSEDMAIEVNPRLTTSYVGLRRLARFNLMEALLASALGRAGPARAWGSGVVRFSADGQTTEAG